jgi:membrane protein implicated in regulation of membrane protease activity
MIQIDMWQIWILISLMLFVAEVFYPVFFFAALGFAALISMIFSFFLNKEMQLLIFSISGLVVFFAVRPVILKHLYKSNTLKTNTDAMIGKIGIVIEDIGRDSQYGRIKLGDETWIAVSVGNTEIRKGDTVIVERIDGVKLYVKKKEE